MSGGQEEARLLLKPPKTLGKPMKTIAESSPDAPGQESFLTACFKQFNKRETAISFGRSDGLIEGRVRPITPRFPNRHVFVGPGAGLIHPCIRQAFK